MTSKVTGEKANQKREEITSEIDHPNPGFVRVDGGITKPVGDPDRYSFVKIGVSVTLPCYPTADGVVEKYDELSELVDKLMDREYEQVIGAQED